MIEKYRDLAKENLDRAKKVLDCAEHKVEHYKNIINGETYDNSNPSDWTKSELKCR